jgi:methylated-DNA-[protein]-cysteine S-methyltransferase
MRFTMAIDSPVGRLTVAATEDAMVSIGWGGDAAGDKTPLLAEARDQLEAYFAGRLTRFDLPMMPAGSPFEQRVWEAMRRIPFGETRRYGELAMEIGSAPRAVGRACGKNPIPIVIPCHRILARGGLGGYSGGAGLPTKRLLLALEGGALPAQVERQRMAPAVARAHTRAPATHAAPQRPASS